MYNSELNNVTDIHKNYIIPLTIVDLRLDCGGKVIKVAV